MNPAGALFSPGEEMSIPAPWLVAQRLPSIQRTRRLHWRSQSHSLSSRGASASFSDRSSGDPDDLGWRPLSERSPFANGLRTNR
jgi:hypothetical protein